MGAVCGCKGVVYINIGKAAQLFAELVIIFLFLRMKPEVFQQQDITLLHVGYHFFHFNSHTVMRHSHIFFQKPAQPFCSRGKAHTRNSFPLWPSEVGCQNNLSSLIQRIIDGRKHRPYPCVLGNISLVIQRHIKVNPD